MGEFAKEILSQTVVSQKCDVRAQCHVYNTCKKDDQDACLTDSIKHMKR